MADIMPSRAPTNTSPVFTNRKLNTNKQNSATNVHTNPIDIHITMNYINAKTILNNPVKNLD